MPIDVTLINTDEVELHSASPHDDNVCLVVTNFFETHGVFKHTRITVASTTVVTTPDLGGAIIMTNILMRARRRPGGGTIALQLSDGTNTEIIFGADVTDGPATLQMNIRHGWRAWKDADLQVITDEDFIVDITIGYAKIPTGEEFSVWDARR